MTGINIQNLSIGRHSLFNFWKSREKDYIVDDVSIQIEKNSHTLLTGSDRNAISKVMREMSKSKTTKNMSMVYINSETSVKIPNDIVIHDFIKDNGLEDYFDTESFDNRFSKYTVDYSFEELSKVVLLLILQQDIDFLLLDDPTQGMDFEEEQRYLSLLQELLKESSITLVLSSQRISWVSDFIKKIVIFDKQRIVESGPTEEILKDPGHIFTRKMVSFQLIDSPEIREMQFAVRGRIHKEFIRDYYKYYDHSGRPFDLKKVNADHFIAKL